MIPLSFSKILELLRTGEISDDMAFIIIQLLTEKYWDPNPNNCGPHYFLVESIHTILGLCNCQNGAPFAAVLLEQLQAFQEEHLGCGNCTEPCIKHNKKISVLFA